MNYCATRARRRLLLSCLATLVLLSWTAVASAQTIVRVEEDWELVVGTPDPDTDAPQVTCAISPLGHVAWWHAALELNSQSLPLFTPGGLQLQLWQGDTAWSDRRFPNDAVLAEVGETIRWTQSMQLNGGYLTFEVIDGTSTTWGSFGGQGYLKATVATGLASLNAYNPAVSVANSGVAYAGNRVVWLALKRVRYYTSAGEQSVDDTVRVVHSQD
jgi:hypothetical protein